VSSTGKNMPRKYSYYPSFDGKKAQPGTEKLADLCKRRWKTKNIGIYSLRLMKNDKTAGKKIGDPGMDKYLSVHATGAALDCQYPDEKVAREMWDWLLKYSEELEIEEIHWYAFGDYGAGYRCSRGPGKSGVKIFTKDDNAGSYQGSPSWLHIEISPSMAKDAAKFEAAWRALPKPE
jgi:hypothetical protein